MYIVSVGAVVVRPGGGAPAAKSKGGDAGIGDGEAGGGIVREAQVGDTFGGLALFPDLAGPTRLDSAVGLAPGGLLYALPAEAAAGLTELYPELMARLRALCALEAIDSRARGGMPEVPEAS